MAFLVCWRDFVFVGKECIWVWVRQLGRLLAQRGNSSLLYLHTGKGASVPFVIYTKDTDTCNWKYSNGSRPNPLPFYALHFV
jgi:hypothetical protein